MESSLQPTEEIETALVESVRSRRRRRREEQGMIHVRARFVGREFDLSSRKQPREAKAKTGWRRGRDSFP